MASELTGPERRPRIRGWIAAILLAVLAAGGVGWAASTVLTPAKDVLDSSSFTTVEVVRGEVASSITLNTVAEWTPLLVGANQATGVVTTVDLTAGTDAGQGATLYTVNLRPVIVAQGDVPAYQQIGAGSKGADVAQLQRMLADLRFYGGAADGTAGPRTVAAIAKWQGSLGLEKSGTVGLGDVIFVPTLPSRIALDTELVRRGAALVGGEAVVQGLPAAPTFEVPVSVSQASLMPTGTRVEITSPDAASLWNGYVVDQVKDDASSTINVTLAGKDGTPICAELCGSVPVVGQALLSSRIVTVESVTGLVVPSAALLTGADGTLSVVSTDGAEHPVTQITSARGLSVIKGVREGLRVRVPASVDAN